MQGLLDLLRKSWEKGTAAKTKEKGIVQYVLEMRDHLEQYREQARENLQAKQQAQKRRYDQHARLRQFQPGQKDTLTTHLIAQAAGEMARAIRRGPEDGASEL